MSSTDFGAFGDVLRNAFRVEQAPTFVARTLRKGRIAVTEVDCVVTDNGLSDPIPAEDAFLIIVQLRECPAHDMFFDGRQIATGHLMPGTACIYDLASKPQANSVSPFHHVSFHLPRATLNLIAEMEDLPLVHGFDHDPGFGVADPVLHGMARCLLPAFRNVGKVSPLFLDHVTTAAVAHAIKNHGDARKRSDEGSGELAPWQLARAKEMLCANLSDLSLEAIAAACKLPPLHFSRAFRRSVGIYPHEWLAQLRAENRRGLAGVSPEEAAARLSTEVPADPSEQLSKE